jgi:hypothetical protein
VLVFLAFVTGCTVGDSPRGPLKPPGNPHLKLATKQNTFSLTMQVPNHAGHGSRCDGPQWPTKTTLSKIPSSRLRLARGCAPPRAGSTLFEGQHFPRADSAPVEGSLPLERVPPRSRVRPALDRGPPRSRAPLTRAPAPVHGHLTPWHRWDGAIMRPGLAPRCRRTNSPGRSPSPSLWGGTVQRGRC